MRSRTICTRDIGTTGRTPNVFHINGAVLVLPPNVLLHIRRLLRQEAAVRALETRRLAALVSQVRHQAALLVVDARAIDAGEAQALAAPVLVAETAVCVFHRPEGRTETWKQK